jgi:hypothetical protein
MSKARKRKKVVGRESAAQSRAVNNGQSVAMSPNGRGGPVPTASATRINPPLQPPGAPGPQSLIFPTMVALGCWGMGFTFLFLSTDPNHTIFGVMAVLMALLWSFSLGMRVRRLVQQRTQA